MLRHQNRSTHLTTQKIRGITKCSMRVGLVHLVNFLEQFVRGMIHVWNLSPKIWEAAKQVGTVFLNNLVICSLHLSRVNPSSALVLLSFQQGICQMQTSHFLLLIKVETMEFTAV